jgi:hypothetical protein
VGCACSENDGAKHVYAAGAVQRENIPEKRLVRRRTRESMLTLYGSTDMDAWRTLLWSALLDVSLVPAAVVSSSSSRADGYGDTGESPLAGKK